MRPDGTIISSSEGAKPAQAATTPPAAQRTAKHPVAGTFSLEDMLNYWVAHDLSHIRQVAELVRTTTFLPNIGNLKKLS